MGDRVQAGTQAAISMRKSTDIGSGGARGPVRRRFPVVSLCAAAVVLLACLYSEFRCGSYTHATDFLKVESRPYFVDLGVLLDGLGVFRQGESPYDKPDNPFNYPPAWRVLEGMPFFNASNLIIIGFMQIAVFYAFTIWLLNKLDCPDWVAAMFLVSPAVVMLLERGNCDLIVYLMLGAGALCLKSPSAQLGVIFVASMLKLFPSGALGQWVYQLRGGWRANFWKLAAVGALFLGGFMLQMDGLLAVSERTPRPVHYMSYGLAALPALFAERADAGQAGRLFAIAGFYAALFAGGVLLWAMFRRRKWSLPETSDASKKLFLAGAGCFLMSNIIGFNWEYRLVFLLFALPEICAWRHARPALYGFVLGSMLLLFYQTLIKRYLDDLFAVLPYKTNHFYLLSDLNNILLCYVLAFTLAKLLLPRISGRVQQPPQE